MEGVNLNVGFFVFVFGAIWCLTVVTLGVVLRKEHQKFLVVEKRCAIWEKCARTLKAGFIEELPDGDYEHGGWMCHIDRPELFLVCRRVEGADEQETFYCLFDSIHMPARFRMSGGKISPDWRQELVEAARRLAGGS